MCYEGVARQGWGGLFWGLLGRLGCCRCLSIPSLTAPQGPLLQVYLIQAACFLFILPKINIISLSYVRLSSRFFLHVNDAISLVSLSSGEVLKEIMGCFYHYKIVNAAHWFVKLSFAEFRICGINFSGKILQWRRCGTTCHKQSS